MRRFHLFIIFFFFNDLSSVDDFYNILYFVVMMDMKVRKSKK